MKILYRYKVRTRLDELINKSTIINHSNAVLRSVLKDPSSINSHVDFYSLLRAPYWLCLDDNLDYLYREEKFDDLQGLVFIITKFFNDWSFTPYSDERYEEHFNSLGITVGTLLNASFVELFYMANCFVEEEPLRFKPAFNMPSQSLSEDLQKLKENKYEQIESFVKDYQNAFDFQDKEEDSGIPF